MFTAPEDLDDATLKRHFETTVKTRQFDMALSYAVEVIGRLENRVEELESKKTSSTKKTTASKQASDSSSDSINS